MIEIRVDSEFHDASILDLGSLLEEGDQVVEIAWGNTRQELRVLHQYPHRDFRLFVPTLQMMERTASILGLPYSYDKDLIVSVHKALQSGNSWQSLVKSIGPQTTGGVLIHIAANSIRNKNHVARLRRLLTGCLLDGISPSDIDVLYKLQRLPGVG